MLKIWGRVNSVNVEKVLWICDELDIAYQRVDAGGQYGVVNTPEYRAMNPNGLVPTVEGDGMVMWESNAIVRYLAGKHSPGDFWPDDLAMRFEADRWMDWSSTMFWPAFRDLFWNLVRMPPEKQDADAIERSRVRSAELFGYLDTHLSKRAYVAGDCFTAGDIPMGCAVWRWMSLPIERPAHPHLRRWFETLSQRPSYAKVVMKPLS